MKGCGSVPNLSLFGGSPAMATRHASLCMSAIIARTDTQMAASAFSLSAQESTLFSALSMPQQCGSGETTSTTQFQGSAALSARFFATKRRASGYRLSLCDKLTPLLISAGLVRGTTPRSARKQCGALFLDTVFAARGGGTKAKRKAALSFLRAGRGVAE